MTPEKQKYIDTIEAIDKKGFIWAPDALAYLLEEGYTIISPDGITLIQSLCTTGNYEEQI